KIASIFLLLFSSRLGFAQQEGLWTSTTKVGYLGAIGTCTGTSNFSEGDCKEVHQSMTFPATRIRHMDSTRFRPATNNEQIEIWYTEWTCIDPATGINYTRLGNFQAVMIGGYIPHDTSLNRMIT
ncbi:MAG: hypothetical protein MUE72_13285, partial [Chitinophagaceae bacterium]|nr:hypothetical protein [Chitinophagaceae bacterium]